MNEIRNTIKGGLLLLAIGFYLASMLYAVGGIIEHDLAALLPALLYLVGGLIATGFERLFE